MTPTPQEKKTGAAPGLLKSAGVVSASIAISRITGLLRESVLGGLFGAGSVFDAYVLGYRIPMLSRELFADGALSHAFVPEFTKTQTTQGHEAARELSNIMGTMVLLIVGVFCLAGIFAAPLFVDIFAPGFQAIPGKRGLAINLVRVMFPFLLFVSLSAQVQGILNANHRFGIPAVSSAIFNLSSIATGLILGHFTSLGTVYGMAAGVFLGGVVQLLFLLPGMWQLGYAWRPAWNLSHPGVKRILVLMGPAILGNASSQINSLVNTNFAAGLMDSSGHVMNGPVSWLSYAFRFLQLPMGVFAVAIASATLPRISRSAAAANWPEFRESLSRSLVLICLLTIPSAAGLITLGGSMIGLVFEHGKFLPSDTHQTALALSCYALGLSGAATVKVMSPAFYALGDAKTPMLVSLSSVVVNAMIAWGLIHFAGMGHIALALSVAAVSTFTSILLILLIRPRIGGIRGGFLLDSFFRIALASTATGITAWLIRLFSHSFLHGRTAYVVDLVLGVPAGVAVFYGLATVLHVPELAEARAAILRKRKAKSA